MCVEFTRIHIIRTVILKYFSYKKLIIIAICSFNIAFLFAQPAKGQLSILVYTGEEPLEFVTVRLPDLGLGGYTDSLGKITFSHFPAGDYALELFRTGYFAQKITVSILPGKPEMIKVELLPQALREVVVTGTMKAVSRSESPVPVEIITPQLFRRNPSPNLFNAVSMVSGVQPVIGCNVCNTGDIHINGMEGPYTMILLDGMPIVSGLGTVYGLMGIPNSLIERVEVVKGPAAALYGSEAMAGMINVITRSPLSSPRLSIDVFSSSWGEVNADFGGLFRVGEKAKSLLGINVFNYSLPQDKNADGFTDLTLEKRISVFNKWAFKRHSGKIANLAFRAIGENRWGGEMNWTPAFGGGDSIYGEHIITRRLESFGTWQWPSKANIFTQYSLVSHRQQSVYGTLPFNAGHDIGFLQNYWEQTFKNHSTLLGIALR